jgi:phosphoglycerate dehydrogenase-like enzyme
MTKIAVWGTFGQIASSIAESLRDDEVVMPKSEAELAALVPDVEVAVGTNNGQRVRPFLEAAPRLRWYHSAGAGVENLVTLPQFRERHITLTNNSGAMDIPIAEHVIAMILAAAKRLHLYRDQQHRSLWKDHRQDELRGRTLVVYGLGSIGGETARLAAALGMRVVGVRRSEQPVPGVERLYTPDRLADAAAEADYLAICAPLTPATRGAVGHEVLSRMKPTAWVINIARGPIIDEAALIEALRANAIGGAALDAHSTEPLPADSPLWRFENVVITPHSSNSSPRVRERSVAMFHENLRRYKAGEPLLNRVDLEAGY